MRGLLQKKLAGALAAGSVALILAAALAAPAEARTIYYRCGRCSKIHAKHVPDQPPAGQRIVAPRSLPRAGCGMCGNRGVRRCFMCDGRGMVDNSAARAIFNPFAYDSDTARELARPRDYHCTTCAGRGIIRCYYCPAGR